jgi:phthiodiolone/phenolphthiodiolone dimycocerosates ketoreductase
VLAGTPHDVIGQLAEWRDHGLRYPVIGNISTVQPSLRRGVAAYLPFAQILREIRRL